MKSRRIRFKLIATFFFISLFSVFSIGVLVFFDSRSNLLSETQDFLQTIASTQSQSIQDYFDQLETRAVDFSSDGFILERTKILANTFDEQTKQQLVEGLRTNKLSLDPSLFLIEIFDTDGTLLATTGFFQTASFDVPAQELKAIPSDTAVLSRYINHESPRGRVPALVALAPITDKQTGERLGYIANHHFLDSLTTMVRGANEVYSFSHLLDWKTLELNLVSGDGMLVVVSDPANEKFLNKKVVLSVYDDICGGNTSVSPYISHN